MIYRKLIKFGNSSHVISLPTDWIKKNKLNKGSVVFLDQDGSDNIIISPNENYKKEESSFVLKTDGKDLNRIKREIYSTYIIGYNEITIHGDSFPEYSHEITEIVHNLMGVEVMESTSSKLVVRDLLDVNSVSVKQIITKMGLITQSLIEDSVKCKNSDDINKLFQRDRNVNRLYVFIKRILNKCVDNPNLAKQLDIKSRDIHRNNSLISCIERIADFSKLMGEAICGTGKKWSKYESEFLVLFNQVLENYMESLKTYHKNDWASAVELADKNEALLDRAKEISDKYNDPSFGNVVAKVKYILDNTRDIIRLVYG